MILTQPQSLLEDVCRIIRDLGRGLSDYKDTALAEDDEYRRQHAASAQAQQASPLEFPTTLDDLLTPSQLKSPKDTGNRLSVALNSFNKLFSKKSPLYSSEAWKWALFERAALQSALDHFCRCNQTLRQFEVLFLGSSLLTRQDQLQIATSIQKEPHSDRRAFVPHIRLRQLAESADYPEDSTVHPGTYLASFLPFKPNLINPNISPDSALSPAAGQAFKTSVPPITAATTQQPRTVIEYKNYTAISLVGGASQASQSTSHDEASPAAQKKDGPIPSLHQLAALLLEAGSHGFRTLPLKYYMNEPSESRFSFCFDYPPNTSDTEPVSLKDLIENLKGSDALSLPLRFHVALAISKALGAFHTAGWLHKSIRSDSIKFFYDAEDTGHCTYREPYLVNFEFSRPEAIKTDYSFDQDLEKNVYRHPNRQGPPSVSFNKAHDLYSLGVVLLEIGVWQTAMSMRRDALKKEGIRDPGTPGPMQEVYLGNARDRLGHAMGTAYREAVVSCLSGEFASFLDKDKDNFTMVFQKKVVEKVDPGRIMEQ